MSSPKVALQDNEGSRRGLDQILISGIILCAAVYLTGAEIFHHISILTGPSANAYVSVVVVCCTLLALVLQRSWALAFMVAGAVLGLVIYGLSRGSDLRHLQYLLPPTFFVMSSALIMDMTNLTRTRKWMLIGALMMLPFWSLLWAMSDFRLPRASAPAVAISVVVLLAFSQGRGRKVEIVAQMSTFMLLCYLALNTSRMGSMVTMLIVVVWIWIASNWELRTRLISTAILSILQLSYWLGMSWPRERLFGRDASISVGPIRVNGEGRVEAASILTRESVTWLEVVLGSGPGSAGQTLVDAGFVLDKPHNEFLRAYFDGGLVLLVGLLALIALPSVVGVNNFRRTRDTSALFVPVSVSLIIGGFSLTDNALSYFWLLLPAGVLIAWSRNSQSFSATHHRRKTGEPEAL